MAKPPKQTSRAHGLNVLLPSLFTVARIVCGFVALVFTFEGMHLLDTSVNPALSVIAFDNAAKAVGWAVLFDYLDGRVARLLGTESDFGLQFDSLADLVTFGTAPAVLLFFWGVLPVHEALRTPSSERLYVTGWIVACTFLVCGAFRLARFNLSHEGPEGRHRNSNGLPIPCAAGAIVAVVHFAKSPLHRFEYGVAWLGLTAILSFLMVSRIRYHLWAMLPPGLHKPAFSLLFGCLLVWGVWNYSEQVLLALALGFVTWGLFAHIFVLFRPRSHLAES